MPELPDVEAYRRFFQRHAAGRTVRDAIADPTILRNTDLRTLRQALRGRTFGDPERHGKWLICPSDGPFLLLHFGMTGDLIWSEEEPGRHRHDRLILLFEGGQELRYRNMRKLGGVWLAHDDEEAKAILGPLGPDALALPRTEFLGLLARRRGGLKAALMDQSFLAGIGNIIADEVLWQARIHPRRLIASLSSEERGRLFRVMHKVLREAVEGYDYIPRKRSWLSAVRGMPQGRCPRCGSVLQRMTVAGRTTYLCPTCQASNAVPWRGERDTEAGPDRRAVRDGAGDPSGGDHHAQRRAAVRHVAPARGGPRGPREARSGPRAARGR